MQVLNVTERLTENYSGKKIANVLDWLLYQSFVPLCVSTSNVKSMLANILINTTKDGRRKVFTGDKQSGIDCLYNALLCKPTQVAHKVFKSKLERSLITDILSEIYSIYSWYSDTKADLIKAKRYGSTAQIGAALNWSKAYNAQYIDFRNMLIEKYIRFAWTECVKTQFETSLSVDRQEMHTNFILAIAKAIDKYDPDKGPLTACVRWWIQETKVDPKFSHVYGQAYDLNSDARRSMLKSGNSSWSVELDDNAMQVAQDVTPENTVEYIESENELFQFLDQTRGTRFARLIYDIPHFKRD